MPPALDHPSGVPTELQLSAELVDLHLSVCISPHLCPTAMDTQSDETGTTETDATETTFNKIKVNLIEVF